MVLKKSLQQGVTLIEMLVVVGIIAVVSATLMFNYSDFSSNVSVRTLSQEIALAVRKAQTYATSVRSIEGTNAISSASFPGYGIAFSTEATAVSTIVPTAKRFSIFADIDDGNGGDDMYGADTLNNTCGSPSSTMNECIETFTISTSDKIVAICGGDAASYVPEISECSGLGTMAISFNRPSPDARIVYNGQSVAYAQIILESAKGLKRGIVVWNTGQIGVQ